MACRKEHVAPVNQLVKDLFCFKEGSEWTYYDSVSQTTQKITITEYEETKLAPKPKGGGAAYEWAEYILINGLLKEQEEHKIEIGIDAQMNEDNTAEFFGNYFVGKLFFTCDANNNFNKNVSYLPQYQLNGIKYQDVYIFNYDNITYYVAKHIGIIRFIQPDLFDLALIDKNIRQ
jgi:hypothetical protein